MNGCIYCSKGKKTCEECKRFNFLVTVDACCDGDGCCTKNICFDQCVYECSVCRGIYNDSEDVYIMHSDRRKNTTDHTDPINMFICNSCNHKEKDIYKRRPHVWYGMSVEEYTNKYG